MNAEARARDYINIMLKNVGYNWMFIIENSDKNLEGKTVIFEEDFLEEIKKAFIAGYSIATENCENSCQNCDHYNGIAFIDECGRPNVSCRLGGIHMGLGSCEDYEKASFEDLDKGAF